jgi:hypothetical protein
MPPKKKSKKQPAPRDCPCKGSCRSDDAYLPAYALLALGVLGVPVSLGVVPGVSSVALPLLLVIGAAVAFARVKACRSFS